MANFLDDQTDAKRLAQLLDDYDRRLKALERTTQVSYTSIEGGSLDIYDEEGVFKGSVGVQPDGGVALVPVNTTPPPTPTAPTVEAVLAGLLVGWDGQWDDAYTTPTDFSLVQVHVGTTAEFTPDLTTHVATITAPLGGTVTIAIDGYDAVWVCLVGQNTAALAGDPSPKVQGQARQAVEQDLVNGMVTEVKLAEAAVTAAKIALGAVGTTALEDGAITAPKILAGAITTAKLDALAVTAEKIASLAITTDKLNALTVTADKLAVNSVTATKIAAGAIEATHIKAGAITTTALAADAITGKTITGGSINGATVTGGVLRTAASGQRVVIEPGGSNEVGSIKFYSGSSFEGAPGQVVTNIAFMSDGSGSWEQPSASLLGPASAGSASRTGLYLAPRVPGHSGAGFNLYANDVSGVGTAQINAYGAEDSAVGSSLELSVRDAPSGSDAASAKLTSSGLTVTGVLKADSIATGRVNITPSAANTPTPLSVTGLNLKGSTFRAVATASTTVPGSTVTGVGVTNVSATGLTIWVTRTNTTQTSVDWIVIAS